MSFEKKRLQTKPGFLKRMLRVSLSLTAVLMLSIGITGKSFAACGSLTMAEMNWASAELMAHVDKIILEEQDAVKMLSNTASTLNGFISYLLVDST